MLTLGPNDIVLGCQAADWEKALDLAAQTLQEAGLVDAEYRHGLYQREAQSSTYLGNAIAIPHGTPESRQYVRRTGVRVIQLPQGVTWHDGQRVHVLVAIAAQNDEHLDILRQLTHVLDRDGIAEQLANTRSAEQMAQQLSKPVATPQLDINTLCLKFPARDIHELAVAAAARLRQAEHVDHTFINPIAAQAPTWLGQGFWLVFADQGVTQPALGIATPHDRTTEGESPLSHDGHPVHMVFCLAAQGQAHRPLLEQLHTLLTQANSAQLMNADAQRLLAQLAGEHDQAPRAESSRLARPSSQATGPSGAGSILCDQYSVGRRQRPKCLGSQSHQSHWIRRTTRAVAGALGRR